MGPLPLGPLGGWSRSPAPGARRDQRRLWSVGEWTSKTDVCRACQGIAVDILSFSLFLVHRDLEDPRHGDGGCAADFRQVRLRIRCWCGEFSQGTVVHGAAAPRGDPADSGWRAACGPAGGMSVWCRFGGALFVTFRSLDHRLEPAGNAIASSIDLGAVEL